MLAIALAAISAAVWGAGDFIGGRASRHADAVVVTVLSQVAGLPVLIAGAFLVPSRHVAPADLMWGLLAGIAGLFGIVLLYRGLASGSMAIFSPVSAVTAAVI